MTESIADLCDQHAEQVRIAQPIFHNFGGAKSFFGQITTLQVDRDFLLIKETLSSAGNDGVLVIDGGGSLDCALLGDRLATMALEHQWAGIVINGCIRDSAEVRSIAFGVKALGTYPKRPAMAGGGNKNRPVTFAGVTFNPGEWLYADLDGVIVTANKL